MASTYSTNLAIELIGTGEQSGTWGVTTSNNLGTLLEQSISGYVTQAITDGSGANTTITIPNGTTGVARNMFIEMTGALTFSTTSLIVPANKKMYFVYNNTTGGYAVTVKVSGQTGILVPNGKKVVLTCNGTDIVEAHTAIVGNATMGGTLGVTGATTLSSTLAVTGATTLSSTLGVTGVATLGTGAILGTPASVTLTSATGLPISTGVSGLGTGVATALGVNTGSAGAMVLFDGAGGTPSSLTGTNITGTAAGLTAGSASAVAVGGITGLGTGVATALAINVGSAGAPVTNGGALGTPTSGTLTTCTGLPISTGVSGLGTSVATFLATPSSANLAAALTDETGSGAAVFAISPILATPALGTPSSGVLSSCTGYPAFVSLGSTNLSGTSTTVAGIPSTAKVITVIINGLSSNGTSNPIIQFGVSSTPETSGYAGTFSLFQTTVGYSTMSAGILCVAGGSASYVSSGIIQIFKPESSNTWWATGNGFVASNSVTFQTFGSKALSGVLDSLVFTMTNGTDSFDAGSVVVVYA